MTEFWIMSEAKASILITDVWNLSSSWDCLENPASLTYSLYVLKPIHSEIDLTVKSLTSKKEQMIDGVLENSEYLLLKQVCLFSKLIIFLENVQTATAGGNSLTLI